MKVKDYGQVFSPESIVREVLNTAGYYGENILKKHVMENSCGDGAFLCEIIKRYLDAYEKKYNSLYGVEEDLKTYIHGIEIDKKIYETCLVNITSFLKSRNIEQVKLDIISADAITTSMYNKKMDFVVGNPPYVRVHNLDKRYCKVKKYSFCKEGMTDLYLLFYEVGLKMLKKDGVLCYITPNSFYCSNAAKKFREYLKEHLNLEVLKDLGHYQPFNVNAYTTICKIVNNSQNDFCKYYKYDMQSDRYLFVCDISYSDLFVDGNIVLTDNKKFLPILNYKVDKNARVIVKNGFATLNDKIFISNCFDFCKNKISVIKASTGQWKECIYPYDNKGKLIAFDLLDDELKKYLLEHKKELANHSKKSEGSWYAFGRSQAINDVKLNKISINTTIKDIDSIKINIVESGKGIYSGLYILTDVDLESIKSIVCCDRFIEYLRVLNKCKSGGYYTFSSSDLSRYINYYLEVNNG